MKTVFHTIVTAALVAVTAIRTVHAADSGSWEIRTNPNFINEIASVGDTLWCATSGGIVRYDMISSSYDVYTTMDGLPTNSFLSVRTARNGIIWFHSGSNLYARYYGGEWKAFTGYLARKIAVGPDGVLWVISYDGIMSFDGIAWEMHRFFPEREVFRSNFSDIEVDRDNTVWITCQDGLLMCSDNGHELITPTEEEPFDFRAELLTDSEGRLVISVAGKLFWKENDGWSVMPIKYPPHVIMSDVNGTMWMGTSEGLVSYDSELINVYDITMGIERYSLDAMAVDSSGRIWYSFLQEYGIGLRCFDGYTIKAVHFYSDVLYNDIQVTVAGPDDTMWIGTYYPLYRCICPLLGGVSRYDGVSWKHFTHENSGLLSNRITAAAFDVNGDAWFGHSQYGVSRFDGYGWYIYLRPVEVEKKIWYTVSSIAFQSDNTGWFALKDNGVARFDGSDMHILTQDDGIICDVVNAVSVDRDDNVWMATDVGVVVYDGKSWTSYPTEGIFDYPLISEIAVDHDNDKWFAFPGFDIVSNPIPGGLLRFDGITWTAFSSEDGLPSDYITTVTVDDENAVWVGTNSGIARYDGEDWDTWSMEDGLADNEVRSIAFDHKGGVWIGTERGLSIFRPQDETIVEKNSVNLHRTGITSIAPNPFNSEVTISLDVSMKGHGRLDVYNILGQKIRTLFNGTIPDGEYRLQWDERNDYGKMMANGVYLIRFLTGGHHYTGKVMYVK